MLCSTGNDSLTQMFMMQFIGSPTKDASAVKKKKKTRGKN
jgi:hypothetical protein